MSKRDERLSEQYCSSGQTKPPIKSESDSSSWKQTGVSASTKSLQSSSSYDNKSLYDSGRTDSGFLSGANLLSSEQYLSEEISTPSSPTKSKEFDSGEIKGDSKIMRLDSGVDVGLDDKFSSLSLTDSTTNNLSKSSNAKSKSEFSCNNITGSYESNICPQSPRSVQIPSSYVDSHTSPLFLPPDIYFQQDQEGDTQLHLAILHNFIEVVYHLIKMAPKRADLDIRNDDHQTPLHLAVLTGQPNVVRWLLNEGASPDIRDIYGNTPLHLAVYLQDISCVNVLLSTVVLDSQKMAERSTLRCINVPNYDGQTCFHLAVLGGNIEIIQRLLDYGANVNAREGKGGYSPLHLAIEKHDEIMCQFLLNYCRSTIDIEVQNYKGFTPYQLACKVYPDLADRLEQCGAEWYPMEDSDESDEEDDEEMIGPFNPFTRNGTNGIVDVSA